MLNLSSLSAAPFTRPCTAVAFRSCAAYATTCVARALRTEVQLEMYIMTVRRPFVCTAELEFCAHRGLETDGDVRRNWRVFDVTA